jgi:RNA polymerase sigma-70 factor (ECF subfamily)
MEESGPESPGKFDVDSRVAALQTMTQNWQTSLSLLQRAADQSDEEAWKEFLQYYDRFIYHLLHRLNLKSPDIDDLHQLVLIRLWENLKNYERTDRRFRSWLAVLVKNIAFDYFRSEKRRRQVFCDAVEVDGLSESHLASSIEGLIEREWEAYMVNFAMNRLRSLFSENAVRVFEMSLEGHSASAISEQLNLGIDSVYTLKNRVKSRLVREVRAVINEVEKV